MSHFTVLVIGENVEAQLAPFHEFECTGKNDQYVLEVDKTDEARKEYETQIETRYQDPYGELHDQYHDRFYREFTSEELAQHHPMGTGIGNGLSWTSKDWNDGKGYRAKAHFLPEGWTEIKVKKSDTETFADFVKDWYGIKLVKYGKSPDLNGKHKYGYALLDENRDVVKVVDRTNPEAKWDWYSIGGRWNGFFKLKAGLTGILGEPGINRMDPDYEPPAEDRADQCMKADIDLDGMREEAAKEAGERYDKFMLATEGCPSHLSWQEVQNNNRKNFDESGDNVDWKAAREEYNEQPAIKALRKSKDTRWFEPDNFLCTREEYVERARKNALTTFAVVKDNHWYERGEMGWWGVVHNEKDNDEWLDQFSFLIDSLPDNTMLTAVDCHI